MHDYLDVNPNLQIAVAITAFAILGGWAGGRIVESYSGRRFPLAVWVTLCASLAIWAYVQTRWTTVFAASLCLAWFLLVLAAIDALVFRLPDPLTLPLIALGLLTAIAVVHDPIAAHAAGALIGFCVFAGIGWGYARWRGREGLGLGDAKLAGAAGAWLGWEALPTVILIACAAGFIWVAAKVIMHGRAALAHRIPFGMALALAIWIVWLYGPLEFPGGG